jgi:O-antigen/teichoic acid export membrane protein
MMSCFFGLCGNSLLMFGYSRVLLMNATAAGLLNLILNALFIPVWGLCGAALATAISNITISVLQMVELTRLEHIAVRARYYLRTLAAATPSLLLVLVGTTRLGQHGPLLSMQGDEIPRIGLAAFSLLAYALLQWLLPGTRPVDLPSRAR